MASLASAGYKEESPRNAMVAIDADTSRHRAASGNVDEQGAVEGLKAAIDPVVPADDEW